MTSGHKTGLASVTEASEFLKISRNTLYEMLRKGALPYRMVGCHKRIPWNSLYEFTEAELGEPQPTSDSKQNAKLSRSDQAAVAAALDRIVAELTSIRAILCPEKRGRWK